MSSTTIPPQPTASQRRPERRYVWRHFLDRVVGLAVTMGGISVLVAILLIFVYLFYVVWPLFQPARLFHPATYTVPGGTKGATLALTLDEYHEIGARITDAGQVGFFAAADGREISTKTLPLPDGVHVTTLGRGAPKGGLFAMGLSNGHALVFRIENKVKYVGGKKQLSPEVTFPLGATPLAVDETMTALRLLTLEGNDTETTLAAITADGRVLLVHFGIHHSLLDAHVETERTVVEIPLEGAAIGHLAMDPDQRWLFLVGTDGGIQRLQLTDKQAPRLKDSTVPPAHTGRPTAIAFLSSGFSLLVGDDKGIISQWFPVRDGSHHETLTRIREFSFPGGAIPVIVPEFARKVFFASDMKGTLNAYHATASRELLSTPLATEALVAMAVSPRGDALLALDASEKIHFTEIENKHPEISWSQLWGKVWYEGRAAPAAIWQSSAATSDFEPKFSVLPLAYGTLKGAFYAMILAVPVAVLGAIYTGYFMSSRTRGIVKPVIEVMAALPSVILGFLAGLWLAPFVERHLLGMFTITLLVPCAVLLASYLWHLIPFKRIARLADGWEAALLLPVIVGAIALAVYSSAPLEQILFAGDLPGWLSKELGITYSQRNSIVVGIAMGIAVVPIVFTISEDAIFNVPQHLTLGSLALGATRWQTLVRVVMLTASPGIFSAVMIGMGRAVGETMIVLMATGNTPIMDPSPFNGFRALSANVAVEMPEAAVDSTHYRILFLTALLLFLVTFVVNTIAELVRQSLRQKYSSL